MNIVITGASSGIGLECVKTLKEDYKDVNFAFVGRNVEALSNLKQELNLNTSKIYDYDLKDSSNIQGVVTQIVSDFGKIDALVYCAGANTADRLRKLKPNLAIDMMSINYLSFIELLRQLVLKKEKQAKFKIVVISSLSCAGAFIFESFYASTKAAIEASVRSLAPELAELNTTINCIRPAIVNTPMIEDLKIAQGENFDVYVKETLNQRLGVIPPKTIANSVSFLLSDKVDGISGDVLTVSGAFSMS